MQSESNTRVKCTLYSCEWKGKAMTPPGHREDKYRKGFPQKLVEFSNATKIKRYMKICESSKTLFRRRECLSLSIIFHR